MKELYPLHGIVTVLNTPFDQDGQIAFSDLRKNVSVALEAGVAGFLVPAMASEVYKLSHEERIEMVRVVLESVAGKVPVIAGGGETDLNKSKRLIKSYLNLGCNHVLFQIQFTDEEKFRRHFTELALLGPAVIMLQDWDASGYGLPDALICLLFEEVEAFRCLKIETVPAGIKYSRILQLTEGRLNVSGGWAVTQMPEGLARGIHAFMPTGMHFVYTQIYQDYVNGNIGHAESLFNQLLPIIAFANQHLDISIHFFKRLLFHQGVYSTPKVRQPILAFDKIHEAMAEKLISHAMTLEEKVKMSRL